MKLSEIEPTLREINVTPVKTLGQNFLHDRNLARWIVEKAKINAEDYIVEIGPGLGALTEFLLASEAEVLALEKDARLVNFLRENFRDPRLEIRHADALDFDLRPLFAKPRVKCIGSLPYYVASRLLLKFTQNPCPISFFLFVLQKEMARRLSAAPATPDYGPLTIFTQARYRVDYLRTVPATVFLPQPEVDSAIVQLTPRPPDELPVFDHKIFGRLARRGFSQRRKQLQKLLRSEVPNWEKAAESVGFARTARAEELSLKQWIALSNLASPVDALKTTESVPERFPVVDENDQVVRDAPRSEVHGNNLRHRAVHILIFNAAGEVFLQKRSHWKDRHPLLWDSSAAGHVNAGEDYDLAAIRELQEELGIKGDLEKITKLPASERTGEEFIWLYRGRHDGPFRLAPSEIECGEFFPVTIISDWIRERPQDFAPAFIECWAAYQMRATA